MSLLTANEKYVTSRKATNLKRREKIIRRIYVEENLKKCNILY